MVCPHLKRCINSQRHGHTHCWSFVCCANPYYTVEAMSASLSTVKIGFGPLGTSYFYGVCLRFSVFIILSMFINSDATVWKSFPSLALTCAFEGLLMLQHTCGSLSHASNLEELLWSGHLCHAGQAPIIYGAFLLVEPEMLCCSRCGGNWPWVLISLGNRSFLALFTDWVRQCHLLHSDCLSLSILC